MKFKLYVLGQIVSGSDEYNADYDGDYDGIEYDTIEEATERLHEVERRSPDLILCLRGCE